MARAGPALATLAVVLCLTLAGVAHAGFREMYDEAELRYWQPRYARGVLWNYENLILPKLGTEERRRLARARLDFPLFGLEDHPLSFYATGDGVVTMPVLSLKFFDDLTVAYAWLDRNGFSLATAFDYVGMLKYKDAAEFGGRYPQPLDALRIPADALEDKAVDNLAQNLFKTAVVFVLLHELGHVRHEHPGYGPGVRRADARQNEAAADAFAIEVMRRLGAAPVGMAFFFQTMAFAGKNRGDFASDAAYEEWLAKATHPVTESRLLALADGMQRSADAFAGEYATRDQGHTAVRFIAAELGRVAEFMADRDLQRLIAHIAANTSPASLAPRRPGEPLGMPGPEERPPGGAPFDGVFDGELTSGGASFRARAVLRQQGDDVSGLYSFGAGEGRITGTVSGDLLEYRWISGAERGRGRIRVDPEGRMEGTWGHGASADDGGTWRARRVADQ